MWGIRWEGGMGLGYLCIVAVTPIEDQCCEVEVVYILLALFLIIDVLSQDTAESAYPRMKFCLEP